MNNILEILKGGVSTEASKNEIRETLAKVSSGLAKAEEFLKNVDPNAFIDLIREKAPPILKKAYEDGTVSEQTVERARRMAVISASPLAGEIYECHKLVFELCKEMKNTSTSCSS
ncbi:MAG: hypothetical protein LBR91_01665 [Puniceicoccales bacterium]|jgi:hypothetical protein|nr:hypothetical protein [Puniceicoccales bacterium]